MHKFLGFFSKNKTKKNNNEITITSDKHIYPIDHEIIPENDSISSDSDDVSSKDVIDQTQSKKTLGLMLNLRRKSVDFRHPLPLDPVGPSSSRSLTPKTIDQKYTLVRLIDTTTNVYIATKETGYTMFSDVLTQNSNYVVVKRQEMRSPRRYRNQALHESTIQQFLSSKKFINSKGSKYIVRFLDEYTIPAMNEHYLVMEYCEFGSLFNTITQLDDPLPIPIIKRMMRDILLGVFFMHEYGVSHRDLKGENIYILYDHKKSRIVCKIGDFGLSTLTPPDFIDTSTVGSLQYCAPEVLKGIGRKGENMDIWSCGVVFYSLLELKLPFDHVPSSKEKKMTQHERIFKAIIEDDRAELSFKYLKDHVLCDFLDCIMDYNYQHRYSAIKALNHPFLEKKTISKLSLEMFLSLDIIIN